MKTEHINEVKAIIILAVGLILFASLISFVPEDLPWYISHPNLPAKNMIGIAGAYLAGSLLFVFGYSIYSLVLFLFFWSWNKFSSRDIHFSATKLISSVILITVLSVLLGLMGSDVSANRFHRAGAVGLLLSKTLVQYIKPTGSYIILITLAVLNIILIGEVLVSPFLLRMSGQLQKIFGLLSERIRSGRGKADKVRPAETRALKEGFLGKLPGILEARNKEKESAGKISPALVVKEDQPGQPQIHISTLPKEKEILKVDHKPKKIGEYHLPSLDLLDDPPAVSSVKLESDLVQGAKVLEATLADFGVTVRVADIERGPVITRYELEPAPGVKVQSITTLSDDISLAMRAVSVRIVAPIPGKNRVGIEVPNGATSAVYLKDVLQKNLIAKPSRSKLMLALGKDIAGRSIFADLADMPHLLIAGTTGSGKTVCVNGLIMSLLFNASPDEVKFLMVDPKMVELTQYNDLPHCLCPAVTDAKKVSSALNWIVGEMESRYNLLSKAGVRNIEMYQAKGQQMPYIVVIIDELADLMQLAAKTIESAITRLAQLSRAVGIHLILATQRPSVDVITGVIKANFPARISFKVASKVDSRTVLDMNGAESLLGRGDMLFLKPGEAKPIRGQCSFVQDFEIQRVIDFIKTQQNPTYDESILQHQQVSSQGVGEEHDELYDEALRLVIETNQASVSILQRRMRLGYTRAARLIDMMEQKGIVGAYCGSKPREILIDREEWMLKNMKRKEGEAV
ncbi:MAG: DNA translocase FtsK [Candidatus Omnitrophota bacterium]